MINKFLPLIITTISGLSAQAQNVGIGISNPMANLHVASFGGSEGNLLITNGFSGHTLSDGLSLRILGYTASVGNSENGDLVFSTNLGALGEFGSPQFWLKPSGAIGIGTPTPGAKLEVAGQVKITGGSPGAGKVLTSDAGGLASWTTPVFTGQWTTTGIHIYNNNTGNVGIGTNTPAANLHVTSAPGGGEGNILVTNSSTGHTLLNGLRIRMVGLAASISNAENGELTFSTNSGSLGAYGFPHISIKPSGAVGIGTSAPEANLEIKGSGALPLLHLNNGFIKVSGANRTAFTITGTSENSSGYFLILNYANQSASDILIVTHNYNPGGMGGNYHNIPVGVYWNGSKWTIFSEDTFTPMVNKSFNVLVIKQ